MRVRERRARCARGVNRRALLGLYRRVAPPCPPSAGPSLRHPRCLSLARDCFSVALSALLWRRPLGGWDRELFYSVSTHAIGERHRRVVRAALVVRHRVKQVGVRGRAELGEQLRSRERLTVTSEFVQRQDSPLKHRRSIPPRAARAVDSSKRDQIRYETPSLNRSHLLLPPVRIVRHRDGRGGAERGARLGEQRDEPVVVGAHLAPSSCSERASARRVRRARNGARMGWEASAREIRRQRGGRRVDRADAFRCA